MGSQKCIFSCVFPRKIGYRFVYRTQQFIFFPNMMTKTDSQGKITSTIEVSTK